MGRLYEKRKQREGRPSVTYEEESNTQLRQNDVVPLDKIDEISNTVESKSTSEKIAEELGVSKRTVERNAQYANAIDKIEEIDEEVAQKILSEEVSMWIGEC